MSHKKEIDDLRSQAISHDARARELRERINKLIYADKLEEYGLYDEEVVEYQGQKLKIIGWEGCSFYGKRINKDGSESCQCRNIYDENKIKKLGGAK